MQHLTRSGFKLANSNTSSTACMQPNPLFHFLIVEQRLGKHFLLWRLADPLSAATRLEFLKHDFLSSQKLGTPSLGVVVCQPLEVPFVVNIASFLEFIKHVSLG